MRTGRICGELIRKERILAENNLSGWLMLYFVFPVNNIKFPHRICPIV